MSRSRPTFACPLRGACALLALSIAICFSPVDCLAAADSPAAIEPLVAAGEFPEALHQAAQLTDRSVRDAAYLRIATAQARAGGRDAWPSTLALVSDDRARSDAYSELALPGTQEAAGGQEADFESLIELITTTIAPQSWDDNGGPGSVKEFEGGVHVDADGLMRRGLRPAGDAGLAELHRLAAAANGRQRAGARSPLRKVSLTRLERQVQQRLAQGRPITTEMRVLAGLERVKYVLVYPDTRDIVLAGPADAWKSSAEGRLVAATSGRPLVQLDDFVVVLRHLSAAPEATFGCSIVPRREALAKAKQVIEATGASPLKPGQKKAWLESIRSAVGRQDVRVRGISADTRVARVLVEADYRMKLVGMGLEPGPLGVRSYLQLASATRGQPPPPLEVLRWWFTLDYDKLLATKDRNAFELRGKGVRVLSENELLTQLGQRVHTGEAEPLNRRFADSFTENFTALAARYPAYAELQNVFDLAVATALIKSQGLADRTTWGMTCFGPGGTYRVAAGRSPRSVETVANHRVVGGKHIIAGVSGGVKVDPWKFVAPSAIKTDDYGLLEATRVTAAEKRAADAAWWWD